MRKKHQAVEDTSLTPTTLSVNYFSRMLNNKPSDLTNKYLARLHLGARSSTQQYARELRHRMTEAEEKLWSLLRNRQLRGKKFRRQHVIANYVVDFYCHECNLAIELDGNFHTSAEAKEHDHSRTFVE